MAARSGALLYRNQAGPEVPFHRNYQDLNDSVNHELSRGVYVQPTRFPDAVTFGFSADIPARGYHILVTPTDNIVGWRQRSARGANGTGRWKNLGTGPADMKGVGFDYFEKVLLNPGVVALGNVVSDTVFNATIQNTFRKDNQTLNSIDNNAGAGITITGAGTPANLAPNADKVYVVTVTTDGPPNINGTIDFITTGGTLVLSLTGTRIIIFPYTPQGASKEVLAWSTDIIKSADGSEQRHALRPNPRQSVSYEISSTTLANMNKIRNLLVDWTSRVFGVPLWWFERSLIADVAVNDTVVFVRPGGLDNADFRIGGLAMVFQENPDGTITQDSLQISDVIMSVASPESTQDTITFATGVQNAYDGSLATVVPVVPSILASPAKQRTPQAGETSRYSMKFDLLENDPTIPGIDNAWYPELTDFDGNDTLIIDDANNIDGGTLAEGWELKLQRIDYGIGKFQQLTQELAARRSTPFNWIVESVQFEWQLRSLLYYLRGKLRNAWIPTHRHDFNVNANIGSGAFNFDVDNWGMSDFVSGQRPWAGLRLKKTDGSISYHRILSVTKIDDTTERVNIEPATSFAATVAEVDKVDLMILARLATDDVTINHDWQDAESDVLDSTVEAVFIGDVQS